MMFHKILCVAMLCSAMAFSVSASDFSSLEHDWCEETVSSRDALADFETIAADGNLPEDERLRARLYAMLCSADMGNIIDTREAFRALDTTTTASRPVALMDFVRARLEGVDAPRAPYIEILEQLLASNPDLPFDRQIMWTIADFYKDLGKPDAAFMWQDRALDDMENTTLTLLRRSEVYVRNARRPELNAFIEELRRANIFPEHDATHEYMHGFQMLLAVFDAEAIISFERALELAPDHPLNMFARKKLAALYWEVYMPDECMAVIDGYLERLDPRLDFNQWADGISYKSYRLWELGRHQEALQVITQIDVDGLNTDNHQLAVSKIAQHYRQCLDRINALPRTEGSFDPELIQLLEQRCVSAVAEIDDSLETWRPSGIPYIYYFHQRWFDLVDYTDWAMENRALSVATLYSMLTYKGIGYALQDHYKPEPAIAVFEQIVGADNDTQTILNSYAGGFVLSERDGRLLNSYSWLMQLNLNRHNIAEARKYYDRMKYDLVWSRTKGELMERYARPVGDK